jgi:hypothetical protein
MIDASESKILEGTSTQRLEQSLARRVGIDLVPRYSFEEILQLFV